MHAITPISIALEIVDLSPGLREGDKYTVQNTGQYPAEYTFAPSADNAEGVAWFTLPQLAAFDFQATEGAHVLARCPIHRTTLAIRKTG